MILKHTKVTKHQQMYACTWEIYSCAKVQCLCDVPQYARLCCSTTNCNMMLVRSHDLLCSRMSTAGRSSTCKSCRCCYSAACLHNSWTPETVQLHQSAHTGILRCLLRGRGWPCQGSLHLPLAGDLTHAITSMNGTRKRWTEPEGTETIQSN